MIVVIDDPYDPVHCGNVPTFFNLRRKSFVSFIYTWIYENGVKEKSPRSLWLCTFGALVGLKEGRETKKKLFNSAKGLLSQRRRERERERKKNDISFSFYIVYFGVSGEKKTFTANFAQSAENNTDPVFIKSDIYKMLYLVPMVSNGGIQSGISSPEVHYNLI